MSDQTTMWATIALGLLMLWLLGAHAVPAAGALIHWLPIAALLAAALHFLTRRR